ncbi:MAG: bifunctional tetrahydrofolate synthase/dihydrofolate synthase [Gammaproteobacteria bacterium]|jgi:dihydrofolate synthase/folylpolyglutamate synthase
MHFDNLNSWLSWLESLNVVRNAYVAKQQVTEVAKRLGLFPFPKKVITVGGTNGKGSCIALLESIYNAAGYKIGVFTSPHLLRFNERIRLQRKNVSDEKIIAAFDLIDKARCDIPLVYFQFAFLAALLIFKDVDLDLVILEVGIGGKYDATNIVDTDLAIISSIDLDHCEILGDTREQIALDKAGIMRSNKPIICGDFYPPGAIFAVAKKVQAKLFCQDKDFRYEEIDDFWNWQSAAKRLENLPRPTNILLQNAATILMAVESFNDIMPVTDQDILQGLTDIIILGRQQLISIDGKKILLDVAHNPAAAQFLLAKLRGLKIAGKKHAIIGFMRDKDIAGTLIHFVDDIDQWWVTELPSPRSAKIEQLESALESIGAKNIQHFSKPLDALQEVLQQVKIGDIIVIFGSFLLVAAVLQQADL